MKSDLRNAVIQALSNLSRVLVMPRGMGELDEELANLWTAILAEDSVSAAEVRTAAVAVSRGKYRPADSRKFFPTPVEFLDVVHRLRDIEQLSERVDRRLAASNAAKALPPVSAESQAERLVMLRMVLAKMLLRQIAMREMTTDEEERFIEKAETLAAEQWNEEISVFCSSHRVEMQEQINA